MNGLEYYFAILEIDHEEAGITLIYDVGCAGLVRLLVWLDEAFTAPPGYIQAFCGSPLVGQCKRYYIIVSGGGRDMYFQAMDGLPWLSVNRLKLTRYSL